MGWEAVQAFLKEGHDWLDSVEGASDFFYPPKNVTKNRYKCRLCGKRLKSERGLMDHTRDKHGGMVRRRNEEANRQAEEPHLYIGGNDGPHEDDF